MKYAVILVAVLGVIIFGTTNSFAQTTTPASSGDPIYMNYDNLGIPGDVTAVGHEKWIEVSSFQWGVGRGISSPTGGSADRESSTPSVSEITITKSMDKSSTGLLKESLIGSGKTVIIDLVKNGGVGQPQTYAQYKLENTLVSKYSVSSGGDNPTESISLNFVKITFNFFPQNPDGTLGAALTTCYNIALANTC